MSAISEWSALNGDRRPTSPLDRPFQGTLEVSVTTEPQPAAAGVSHPEALRDRKHRTLRRLRLGPCTHLTHERIHRAR